MAAEEWRPVRGLEGFYEVSSLGRARSKDRVAVVNNRLRRKQGHILHLSKHKFGYPMFKASVRGSQRMVYVHRAVCEAFHGPAPDGHQVAHNDGYPANARADNLRWATPKENMADCAVHGTKRLGPQVYGAKLTYEQVAGIRAARDVPQAELAKKYSVSQSRISAIRLNQSWVVAGAEPIHDRRRLKLSPCDVAAIRASGEPATRIASAFGISRGHVSAIRAGRRHPALV